MVDASVVRTQCQQPAAQFDSLARPTVGEGEKQKRGKESDEGYLVNLLLPHPTLHSLELIVRHPMARGEITSRDFSIDLDSRIGRDQFLGELDTFVDRNTKQV